MGMDEDNDDGLGGRSRDRREVTEQNRWGEPLCALSAILLEAAPLPDLIREAVALGRELRAGGSRSYRARDRQYQRIDKLIRTLSDAEIEAIDLFLATPDRALEEELDRLLAGGDDALQTWLETHPGADRNQLRTLLRAARKDPGKRGALLAALSQEGA